MKNTLDFLRGSVRPILTYLFSLPFIGLAVYAFIKFGTEELANGIVTGFIGIVGVIAGIYFQSRSAEKK